MKKILHIPFEFEHYERLLAVARTHSMSPATYIKLLLAREVPPPEKLRVDPLQTKQFKELTDRVRKIYSDLRVGKWAGHEARFDERFGLELKELDDIVESRNLERLEGFFQRHPWK